MCHTVEKLLNLQPFEKDGEKNILYLRQGLGICVMKEASRTGRQRPLTVYPVGGTDIQKSSNASKYTGDVSIYTFFTFTSAETKAIPSLRSQAQKI